MALYDEMAEFERLRKRTSSGCMGIVAVVVSAPIVFIFLQMLGEMLNNILVPIVGFIIWLYVVSKILAKMSSANGAFTKYFKENFVPRELNNYFSDVSYDWRGGFTSDQIKSFGISMLGNRFGSEDLVNATYNGVKFTQADVRIEYKPKNDDDSPITYFRGRVLTFDFPKKDVTSIQLYSSNFKHPGKNPLGYVTMHDVETESKEFNKTFKIKSANEHDAFYVLTPQLMEKLMELHKKYYCLTMHIARGKVYLGISNLSDSFEPTLSKNQTYYDIKDSIKKDLQETMDIIDVMAKGNS